MQKQPHKLRFASNALFRVAMLPVWPLCVAKLLASLSNRIYYAH